MDRQFGLKESMENDWGLVPLVVWRSNRLRETFFSLDDVRGSAVLIQT